jgi:uncharacterized protein (TIGR00299 family) protein
MPHDGHDRGHDHHEHDHHDHAHRHEHGAHRHSHDHHHHHHHHDHDHTMAVVVDQADPVRAQAHRAPLERGAGAGKTLFFDLVSGIAGDMTIAGFVDLGVPFSVVEQAAGALGLGDFALELARARAGAIGGTHFDVRTGPEQPDRRYRDIVALIDASGLAPAVKGLAQRIFKRLAEAESEVHRTPIEDVAFHEVGAVDAIVDVVGAAACAEYLGARVVSTAVPLGRGHVHCAHGTLPLPAPAALLCLRGVPTVDSGLDVELVTPTGAAILATLAEGFVARWPALSPERVGWGVGTRSLHDRPNALRMVLGAEAVLSDAAGGDYALVEANVDDLTGELAAHAIAALLEAGALDAWASPVTMKKGRPGLVLSAICRDAAQEQVSATLLRETSSIGVRRSPVTRTERPRRVVEVETSFGRIPLKVSEGPFGPPQVKPEFDACARAAREHGATVREVIAAALAAFAAR